MKLQVLLEGEAYQLVLNRPVDCSIPMDFLGPQPSHFGARAATAEPMRSGGFVGDTRQGGSCNADVVSINPHCNGTHTECVGHLTVERVPIALALEAHLFPAALVSVTPDAAAETDEGMDPGTQDADQVITREALEHALDSADPGLAARALVVRTLPNDESKRGRRYQGPSPAAFFTTDAVAMMIERGIEHLVCDLPSIDRAEDGGRLLAHRAFWGLPGDEREAAAAARPRCTITELAFVPDEAEDGLYLLDLQVAPFMLDAAPSRPILYPLDRS